FRSGRGGDRPRPTVSASPPPPSRAGRCRRCRPRRCRLPASAGRAGDWNSCAAAAAKMRISRWRLAMARVVSLFLPRWPTDRLRRKSPDAASLRDAPLVLVGHDGSRRVVAALDATAERLGLRVGMSVARAQALSSGLVLRPAEPQADAQGLELLAQWALQHISPVVAADPPDGLVLDTTGAEHLHGGEA